MEAPPADPNKEDQIFNAEVAAVKKWWTDSRWRYTKRPFTAEQIVAKRGTLKIEYPSNAMSKKLWNILEHRIQVWGIRCWGCMFVSSNWLGNAEWRRQFHLWLLRAHHVDSDGQVLGHCLCIWLAIIVYCTLWRWTRTRFGRLPICKYSSRETLTVHIKNLIFKF